ncbi:hypothetical protein ACK33S_14590 [Aeromonas hydrophila]|uniref:hypothetical protein n=1 Tax=Aeromonas hydrophila TaxID=644 RepID=UPI0039877F75
MKKIGDRSVVMGHVGDIDVGSDSVYVGATDLNGNTFLRKTMAVGSGAKAGPGSISIGFQAGAGIGRNEMELRQALADLEALILQRCDEQIREGLNLLRLELASPSLNKGRLKFLLSSINVGSSLDGVANLIDKAMNLVDRI